MQLELLEELLVLIESLHVILHEDLIFVALAPEELLDSVQL